MTVTSGQKFLHHIRNIKTIFYQRKIRFPYRNSSVCVVSGSKLNEDNFNKLNQQIHLTLPWIQIFVEETVFTFFYYKVRTLN